ncbi:hypothetical protein As57867_012178, partial [Aphanomyces stellatus]
MVQLQSGLMGLLHHRIVEANAMKFRHTRVGYDTKSQPIGIYHVPAAFQTRFAPLLQDGAPRREDKFIRANDLFLDNLKRDPRLVFHLAIFSGDLPLVQALLHHDPVAFASGEALSCAVSFGHEHLVDYLIAARTTHPALRSFSQDGAHLVLDIAATHGRYALLEFLRVHEPNGCSARAMDHVAALGNLDMVRFLHATRTEGCTTAAMDTAAACGHLEVVRFLHDKRPEGCTTKALDSAAGNGHIDVVRFLVEHRTEGATPAALHFAAEHGHLEVLEYLCPRYPRGWSLHALDAAARHGHVDVVRF